jgi:[glutamine synthetase] adenylyltransferase / [glutamine synthetase]-adenylyl-L-tyrosine phosphorylase
MLPTTEPPAGAAFLRPERARENLQKIAARLPASDLDVLRRLLPQSPDPDAALDRLERFLSLGQESVHALRASPQRLHAAVTLFAFSAFLTDVLSKRPRLLEWALRPERFYRALSAEEMRAELAWIDPDMADHKAAMVLARFRNMQILRIALRDLLGVGELGAITLELSNLADALLEGAHDHVRSQLARRFGRPLLHAGEADIEGRFVALALGKLGGRELNYSSDIDLLYLHTGDGLTSGPVTIPNHDFYLQLATRLTGLLSQTTAEGFCYRVDLRLRPEGAAGELVSSLSSAVAYYHDRARDWELQTLIKARPAAGDLKLGASLLNLVRPLIYSTTTDFSLIERLSESRDRIHSRRRKPAAQGVIDVKLDPGGIRDIEFLVQCLQRLYGGNEPFVRSGGTLFALHRLHERDHISSSDYGALSAAYQFLRVCEHRLQLLDNRQTHRTPNDPEQLRLLERRLHGPSHSLSSSASLPIQLQSHFAQVREIYQRIIRSQPMLETKITPSAAPAGPPPSPSQDFARPWLPHLRQIELSRPQLAQALSELPVRRGRKLFGHLLETLVHCDDALEWLQSSPALVALLGDLVEHSPYLTEQILRHPADLAPLVPGAEEQPEGPPPDQAASPLEQSMTLRRTFRRRMLAILADSIHRGRPVFDTLARTSDLAEWALRRAYSIAMQATVAEQGLAASPPPAMQVIALGRLGMRELDLGSDADVAFVIPDAEAGRLRFWNAFAARLIDILSSYTAEGRIFSVDPRLRPGGRDGELVQTESAFVTYFAKRAEAWESLSYLKARTVAGDLHRGRDLLRRIQSLGWERFGRSSDLAKLLRGMRARLETEQGRANPLKAGAGGYYDVDYILLYLRLRDAGLFFESLSTPQRIAIVRASGALNREQAERLRGYAVFFRAFDHAIRASTGRPSATLPASLALRETVYELLIRWDAVRPPPQPLSAIADQVRRGTRDLYREILGPGGR